MKKALYWLLFSFSWLNLEAKNKHDTTVIGTVYDFETLEPIKNATLELHRGAKGGGGLRYSTTSNETGGYKFERVIPSQYQLVVSAEQYEMESIQIKPNNKGVIFQDIYLVRKGLGVVGRVVSSKTGEPIHGAHVMLLEGATVVAQGISEYLGEFVVKIKEKNPLATYSLDIVADGYETKSIGIDPLEDGPFDISVSLVPMKNGVITGKVTDEKTNKGISNAKVYVSYEGKSVEEIVPTDANGKYVASGLASGSYFVRVEAKNYEGSKGGVIVDQTQTTTFDLSLKKAETEVTGTIFDKETKKPLIGAVVEIHDHSLVVGSSLTDQKGRFSLSGLELGSYAIVVSGDGYQPYAEGLHIQANDPISLRIELEKGIERVVGHLTDSISNDQIIGATIQVFQDLTNILTVQSDTKGFYNFSGLGVGSYVVTVSHAGYQSISQGIIVEKQKTLMLDFALQPKPGKIAGSLLNGETNEPISNAKIEIYLGSVLVGSILSDSKGQYLFSNLAPNTYSVMINAAGYQRSIQNVEVVAGKEAQLDFAMQEHTGFLSGKVYDADSKEPIRGARVSVFSNDQLIGVDLSDDLGMYDIHNLAPGEYTLIATASAYETLTQKGKILPVFTGEVVRYRTSSVYAGESVDFPLVLGGESVNIHVTDACSGFALDGAKISINENLLPSITDSNGNLFYSGLSSGSTVEMKAIKEGYLTDGKKVEIRSGGTSSIYFALSPYVLPPESIECKCVKNKFLVETCSEHVIRWAPSPSGCLYGYQIYRDGELIAFISPSESLEYTDVVSFNKTHVYSVRAINAFGKESAAVSVTMN